MTAELAIQVLENIAIDMTGALAELSNTNAMADVFRQRIDAIDEAQKALRTRAAAKRVLKNMVCRSNGDDDTKWIPKLELDT